MTHRAACSLARDVFCHKIATSSEWGGNFTLTAAAHVYGHVIRVWAPAEEYDTYHARTDGMATKVGTLEIALIPEVHYMSVEPGAVCAVTTRAPAQPKGPILTRLPVQKSRPQKPRALLRRAQ
jgi:hypothetical protein